MSRVISSRKKFGIVFCLCYSVLTFISATADFDFRSAVLLLHTSKQSFHRKKLALTVTYFFVLIKICGLTDEVDLADNVVCLIAEHFIHVVTFSRYVSTYIFKNFSLHRFIVMPWTFIHMTKIVTTLTRQHHGNCYNMTHKVDLG